MDAWSFSPVGASATRAVTTTTASVALPTGGNKVLITNVGPDPAYIAFGISTVEAVVATGIPILPLDKVLFARGPTWTHVAAISAATEATTIIATAGIGS